MAVLEPAALNLLNNTAAKVTEALAFAKGDCQELIKELNQLVKAGGYAEYEMTDECSFKRAFWATKDQVEGAKEFGLDVIQQVWHRSMYTWSALVPVVMSCSRH